MSWLERFGDLIMGRSLVGSIGRGGEVVGEPMI